MLLEVAPHHSHLSTHKEINGAHKPHTPNHKGLQLVPYFVHVEVVS